MTREDIVRLWDEANNLGIPIKSEFAKELERFAAIFEAAERDRRAFELAECYRCGWDSGVKAERDACVTKIQAEIYNAITNGTRLSSARSWGDLAVPVSNLDSAIAAIRARGKK